MNRRVEYMGAPINIPYVLSGIQTFIEEYFGRVIKMLAAQGGIVRPISDYVTIEPPCGIYNSFGYLWVRSGQILFPIEPFPVVEIDSTNLNTSIASLVADPVNHTFYVYAIYNQETSGVLKKRANGFVYNDSLSTTYYDQLTDTVTFEISTSLAESTEQKVLIATLYNNMSQVTAEALGYTYDSGLTINQIDGASFTEHGIMAKFADRYLTLNSIVADLMSNDIDAGIKVLADTSNTITMLVVPSGTDYRWEANVPITAHPPLIDSDLTTMGWVKQYIQDTLFEVPDILNFRMYDIGTIGSRLGGVETTETSRLSLSGGISTARRLRLYFKWGYDTILGTGTSGTNYFDISNVGLSFTDNELNGYYFWIPQLQKSFIIDTNVGNRLYLENEDHSAFTFAATLNITTPDTPSINAWIHMNAKNYEIIATPMTVGIDPQPLQHQIFYSESPTHLSGYIDVDAGVKYSIKMRGTKGNEGSSWQTLPTGTFDKYYPSSNDWVEDIPYGNPFVARHPNIPYGLVLGEALVLTSTTNGFNVEVNEGLWPDAEQFEIVYSTSPNPSFSNRTLAKKVFSSRSASIVTTISGYFYVKIRPLIAGLQVCDDTDIVSNGVQASVVGSTVGEVIAEFAVNFQSYRFLADWNEGDYTWDITSIYAPAIASGVIGIHGNEVTETEVGISRFPNLDGFVATRNGVDYVIDQVDGDSLYLLQSNGNLYYGTIGQTGIEFKVGISTRGRRVHRSNAFIKDYRIVRVDVTVDALRYYPVNLRVYQEGRSSDGDNITLDSGSTTFVQDMDVLISGSNGNRNLIIDLYDPAHPGSYQNAGGFVGYVKVYAIPVTQTIGSIEPVTTD